MKIITVTLDPEKVDISDSPIPAGTPDGVYVVPNDVEAKALLASIELYNEGQCEGIFRVQLFDSCTFEELIDIMRSKA